MLIKPSTYRRYLTEVKYCERRKLHPESARMKRLIGVRKAIADYEKHLKVRRQNEQE